MELAKGLAKFDSFQKSKEHLQVRTLSGATVSLIAGAIMLVLFLNELVMWRSIKVEDHLLVDTSQGERDVQIDLDVTFHMLPCKDVMLIVEDSKGVPYDESHVRMTRAPTSLGPDPRIAKTLAMNPRAPGLSDAMSTPGCRLVSSMRVKKVAGDFHIAAPRQLVNMDGHFGYAIPPEILNSYNASHTINSLTFGPSFPGQVNPLSGYTPSVASTGAPPGPSMWQYHIKVVPTLFEWMYGSSVDSQQYSASDFVTTMEPGSSQMVHPGVWWRFDFSPIMVRKKETRRSVLSFLTSVFAILGGVYALSGILDQLLFRTMESRKAK